MVLQELMDLLVPLVNQESQAQLGQMVLQEQTVLMVQVVFLVKVVLQERMVLQEMMVHLVHLVFLASQDQLDLTVPQGMMVLMELQV
jgi:hypothetical protein